MVMMVVVIVMVMMVPVAPKDVVVVMVLRQLDVWNRARAPIGFIRRLQYRRSIWDWIEQLAEGRGLHRLVDDIGS
jgi:hypothetical protein